MDAKLREDLFRRYVASLENRLEEGTGEGRGDKQGAKTEEALISTATALLGSYQPDPGQRFRMVRFYDIAENSLRTQRGANLRTLETAFATLETICTNLLLFPWKKEFRCIKVSKKIKGVLTLGDLSRVQACFTPKVWFGARFSWAQVRYTCSVIANCARAWNSYYYVRYCHYYDSKHLL